MKRLLIAAVALALLASLGTASYTQEPGTVTFGIVTYQYESFAFDIEKMVPILEREMELLPALPGTNNGSALPQPPRNDPAVEFEYKVADTAAAQAAAIDEFVAAGVDGIMLVPVTSERVRDAVTQATLAGVPVVFLQNPMPTLEGRMTAFVGVEPFATGVGWTSGAAGGGRTFNALVSDLSEPRQGELVRGMRAQAGDLLQNVLVATPDDAFDVVTEAFADNEINYLIVADPALLNAAAEAIVELTTGADRLIKLGSFGEPENMMQLFDDRVLHMVTTQDHFKLFQEAALELKMFAVATDPLETIFLPARLRQSADAVVYMTYPYDYQRTLLFTFDRFWR